MNQAITPGKIQTNNNPHKSWARLMRNLAKYKWVYFMMIPGLIYFLLFRYLPCGMRKSPSKISSPSWACLNSPFVGFKHFLTFFNSFYFSQLIGNTIILQRGQADPGHADGHHAGHLPV